MGFKQHISRTWQMIEQQVNDVPFRPDDEAGEVTLKKRSKGARRAARPFQSAKNSWNCGQRPKRPQAQLTVYAPIKGT